MKKLLCLTGGAMLMLSAFSQEIKPLYIDDPFPNISFGKIINYKCSTASLKDFKGKSILLDFWFTHCGTCIEAMPELDSMQKMYGDKLQIIMVAHESDSAVTQFLKSYETKHNIKWSIPCIVEDTILHKYFRHLYEPNYAILDPENRLVAKCSFFFMNKELIGAYLKQLPEELYQTGYIDDTSKKTN
ncbi:Thiol-disulfide isomerase or thioredoxin [Arachidicoccus rhizosphaerae]|uniref:Thiol-disulfide isomerase or thioredoxin n=1 Tax=Arachidicoccus rhizosphaerae TaxID=551991 RepID=A0A1H4A2D1_9BACT|nr:TlpA disulfide reductase family protein [Arachidicoccus rhizosphaerae]SEA30136.1 Thiol-disulfide isomerase or thioredoxin [Arachidicoccus rhizosphaerae]